MRCSSLREKSICFLLYIYAPLLSPHLRRQALVFAARDGTNGETKGVLMRLAL
jgi:hypothetical protein